jgi:hypothetical protein
VHGVGVHLLGERDKLGLGPAMADEQPAPAAAQPAVEIAEALEHELGAGPRGVAAFEQAVVEAEHRDHPLVGTRGLERRMVVQAQVTAQPQNRGHAMSAIGAPSRISRTAA